VDFIKLDIQGAEAMAIRGAEQTLERNRDIQLVMEYAPRQMHLNWREIHSACRDARHQHRQPQIMGCLLLASSNSRARDRPRIA
jgi:Methyltransferase FkbM domain